MGWEGGGLAVGMIDGLTTGVRVVFVGWCEPVSLVRLCGNRGVCYRVSSMVLLLGSS